MNEKASHILVFSQMSRVLHILEAHCHSGAPSNFLSALGLATTTIVSTQEPLKKTLSLHTNKDLHQHPRI